jgi:tetratricopeptide (TPR) repeat protein
VVDLSRIEELRRRIQKDPASIAFAQLAEEYRRAGRLADAIETCRTGLKYHPGYLSAYVTLGRALIETGDLQAATEALSLVHAAAPDNLAAIKGLDELGHLVGVVTDELRERAPVAAGAQAAPTDSAARQETAAEPAGEAVYHPPDPAAPSTAEQIAALERWLDAILADRASRT